jgi:hypothetical protein
MTQFFKKDDGITNRKPSTFGEFMQVTITPSNNPQLANECGLHLLNQMKMNFWLTFVSKVLVVIVVSTMIVGVVFFKKDLTELSLPLTVLLMLIKRS